MPFSRTQFMIFGRLAGCTFASILSRSACDITRVCSADATTKPSEPGASPAAFGAGAFRDIGLVGAVGVARGAAIGISGASYTGRCSGLRPPTVTDLGDPSTPSSKLATGVGYLRPKYLSTSITADSTTAALKLGAT